MERIFTERAHLMCPHMNFGIGMVVDNGYDGKRIREVFGTLAVNHPFLRAVLGYVEGGNAYFYDVTEDSKISLALSDETLTDLNDPKLLQEYERIVGYDWDIRKEGLLKAVAWEAKGRTAFLLVFHHLLADGRGALHLAQELAEAYVENRVRGIAREKLISSAKDFPEKSKMGLVSRLLIAKANKDWEKEGRQPLSYQEYHDYADDFVKDDHIVITLRKTPAEEVAGMNKECKEHGVTVNDYLMAKMYQEEKTNKIIIAKDLRDEFPFYERGALGNYSTAFSVVIKKREADVWILARKVHEKVRKIISNPKDLYLVLQCYASLKPEVLDAAFMAAKGAVRSKSAEFIGKAFFGFEVPKGYSITNLGRIENTSIVCACFIPPASPAIRKTLGVLTVNGEMNVCSCERV